jgi:predicted transcriptional regulator
MSLTIDLPPEVERGLREEAARTDRSPEELAGLVLSERFHGVERRRRAIDRVKRWSEEDRAEPEPGPVPIPPRTSMRVPDSA